MFVFYWCISCSVIISYLLTALFDARLMHLIKSVIHSFIHSFIHERIFMNEERVEEFRESAQLSSLVGTSSTAFVKICFNLN